MFFASDIHHDGINGVGTIALWFPQTFPDRIKAAKFRLGTEHTFVIGELEVVGRTADAKFWIETHARWLTLYPASAPASRSLRSRMRRSLSRQQCRNHD